MVVSLAALVRQAVSLVRGEGLVALLVEAQAVLEAVAFRGVEGRAVVREVLADFPAAAAPGALRDVAVAFRAGASQVEVFPVERQAGVAKAVSLEVGAEPLRPPLSTPFG